MSEKSDKTWDRPWTKQDFIDNADNWSLAGDVALLNTLKAFSDTLLTKANEVNNNLNNLTKRLDNTALRLSIAQNEFQSLRNNQFIESRVYEEDETLPSANEEKKVNENENNNDEDVKVTQMKDAVYKGLKVLDKYFDKVEVNVSDTEDEAEYTSYVLKPKDMYIDRPLPYVIGTEEWHKKWHVGLVDSSSESEIEEIIDKFSDTDSESDLPIPNRSQVKGTSDTSSELDFQHKTSSGRPAANSTFADVRQDTFGSSDSDQSSLPVQAPISNETFAEQLAAKLGTVISQKTEIQESEVNTRPLQKTSDSNRFPALFFDEPPPLDEEDDMFHNAAPKGLFSGGNNLFDDDHDEDSSRDNNKEATSRVDETVEKPTNNLFDNDEEEDDLFPSSALKNKSTDSASSKTPKLKTKSLFDDDESSDDDIFKTARKNVNNKPSFWKPASKVTIPLYDDEPPALETEKKESPAAVSPRKKPPGGIFLPGANDIIAKQKLGSTLQNRPEDSTEYADNDTTAKSEAFMQSPQKIQNDSQGVEDSTKPQKVGSNKPETSTDTKEQIQSLSKSEKKISLFDEMDASPEMQSPSEINRSKKLSLFEEVDDLFKDDLFSAASTKKFTSSLFDDDLMGDDVFSSSSVSKATVKDTLFDEEDPKALDSSGSKMQAENSKPKLPEKPQYILGTNTDHSVSKADEPSNADDLLPKNNNSINADNERNISQKTKHKENVTAPTKQEAGQVNVADKVTNLFDDDYDDDIFETSKLSSKIKAKFSLFDDVPVIDDDDLFSNEGFKTSATTSKGNQRDLFSGDSSQSKPKQSSVISDKKEEDVFVDVHADERHTKIISSHQNETESSRTKINVVSAQQASNNGQVNRPTHLSLVTDLDNRLSNLSTTKPDEGSKTPSSRPPPVNIFSSSPPPEDDTWDSKSDDNDPFFDEYEANERSELFDGPLGVPSYDSSGIGHENTRVDTDVSSSFNPYASSSRRLSSDMYNEQQSADSFFVTKNKTEPLSLGVIDEDSRLNKNVTHPSKSISRTEDSSVNNASFDITPSGKSTDLFCDPNSTLGYQSAKSEPSDFSSEKNPLGKDSIKILHAEKDSSRSDIYDEIEESANQVKTKKLSIVDQLNNECLSIDGGINSLEDSSETSQESKGKNVTSLKEKLENANNAQESDKVKITGSPGKLKHNLNIDVGALLPRSLPPKRKELPKSQSFESSSVDECDFIPTISSDKQPSSITNTKAVIERSSSFESKSSEVEVLQSITKDRARVPLGRKPSTRRGRRELRKVASVDINPVDSELQTETKDNSPDNRIHPKIEDDISFNVSDSNVDSQKSGVEKLSPPKDVPKMVETLSVTVPEISEAINVKTKTKPVILFDEGGTSDPMKDSSSLFGSTDLDEDDDLFSSIATKRLQTTSAKTVRGNTNLSFTESETPTERAIVAKQEISIDQKLMTPVQDKNSKTKTDIFDSDDDSDDIFSSKVKKVLPTKPNKKELVKKPLFSDDEDDGDLFGSSISTKNNAKIDQKRVVPQKPRTTAVKKLQNIETDDDPLSSLLK